MRRLLASGLLATIPALVLAGCAAADQAGGRGSAGQGAAGAGQRYEANATVLQNQQHGPELCLGAVLDSLPPQCGGLPITNWSWDRVEGEQRQSGVTWGSYHVVGTYDGTSFTVTDVSRPGPPPPAPQPGPFEPACRAPRGGWPQPDPARATPQDMQAAVDAARAAPDFAGAWVAYLEPLRSDPADGSGAAADTGEFVLNVAFTGDLDRHESQVRERWGGRLCVTRKARALRDLARIQRELEPSGAVARDLGLEVLSTGLDEYANAVTVGVVAGSERARAALDQRYGRGAVRLDAALTPVP